MVRTREMGNNLFEACGAANESNDGQNYAHTSGFSESEDSRPILTNPRSRAIAGSEETHGAEIHGALPRGTHSRRRNFTGRSEIAEEADAISSA